MFIAFFIHCLHRFKRTSRKTWRRPTSKQMKTTLSSNATRWEAGFNIEDSHLFWSAAVPVHWCPPRWALSVGSGLIRGSCPTVDYFLSSYWWRLRTAGHQGETAGRGAEFSFSYHSILHLGPPQYSLAKPGRQDLVSRCVSAHEGGIPIQINIFKCDFLSSDRMIPWQTPSGASFWHSGKRRYSHTAALAVSTCI